MESQALPPSASEAHAPRRAEWPQVSVIIVNLDGWTHLETCLSSLAAAEYPESALEIIVFDNGSTDGSREALNRDYPYVKVMSHHTNLGFAQPNNLAARAARGEYLALLNNDVRIPSRWLKDMVSPLLDRDRQAEGVVCTAGRIMNWQGDRHDFNGAGLSFCGHGISVHLGWPTSAPAPQPDRSPVPVLFGCGASMLIRRDVFLELGGFDDDYFAYYEDVDLGLRLWSAGYRVLFVPGAVTHHHHRGTAAVLPPGEHLYLLERNALFTLFKNVETRYLERFLPAALYLLEERSRLDVEHKDLYDRARRDFTSALPRLQSKRLVIQARRQRPDHAIFPLFREPFRPRLFGHRYWASQVRACRSFTLYGDFFGESSMADVRLCEDFVEEVQRGYEELSAELARERGERQALMEDKQRLEARVAELERRLQEQQRRLREQERLEEENLKRILGELRREAAAP
jgi:GT2 family glycosyltransferase